MSEEKLTRAAVVTGGSRGIGRAVCVALAKQGCNVVVNYCHGEAAAAETAALCKELGVEAVTVQADVSTAEGCKKLFEEAVNAFGRVDILVNNAGVGAFGSALDVSEERVRTMLRLNMEAVTRLTLFCAKRFQERGHGRILNIASTGAFQPCPWLAVYGATKAYVLSFSEALSEELKGTGVTVTAFCPGPTRTNFGTAAGLEEDSPFDEYAQDVRPVARAALDAAFRGAPVEIEGWLNRLVAVVAQIAPRTLVRQIAAKLLRKMR